MNVLLLSRYERLGASSRLRSYQYIPFLEENGIHVTVAPLLPTDYLLRRYNRRSATTPLSVKAFIHRFWRLITSRGFDLLWVEKEIFPWLPFASERIWWGGRVPLMVDYDDAIFHRYDQSTAVIVRHFLGQKIDKIMKSAALVVAGNRYLARRAGRAGARWVEIVPTVVDIARYGLSDDRRARNGSTGTLRIGWVGSPTTVHYLTAYAEVFRKLLHRYDIMVVNVGGGDINMPGVPLENRAWTEDSEVSCIHGFDIGIMPLIGTPWDLGKCGYKLIQYMACGKPVVASAVGANLEIVDHGVNGFLAHRQEDFIKALSRLIDDPGLRFQMGRNGRRLARERYSLQSVQYRLLDMIKKASTMRITR